MQRCDPPEQSFAQSWPAIRDWGPYSPDKTDDASSSSDSDSDIEVEQALLDDAQRTFWKSHPEGKPKTGIGFMLQAYILAVLIIVWLYVACCNMQDKWAAHAGTKMLIWNLHPNCDSYDPSDSDSSYLKPSENDIEIWMGGTGSGTKS